MKSVKYINPKKKRDITRDPSKTLARRGRKKRIKRMKGLSIRRKKKKKKRKRKFLHSSNRRQRRPCFQTRRSHFLSTKIYIHIHVYIHTHTCIREWSTVSNKTVSSTKPLTVVSRFNTFS